MMKVNGKVSDTGVGESVGAQVEVEGLIDKSELGKRTGMRPRTIDDWMNRGILPYYKLGRSVRFKWSEIETHLATRCRVVRDECRRL